MCAVTSISSRTAFDARSWFLNGEMQVKGAVLMLLACGFGAVGRGRWAVLILAGSCAINTAALLVLFAVRTGAGECARPAGGLRAGWPLMLRACLHFGLAAVLVRERAGTIDTACVARALLQVRMQASGLTFQGILIEPFSLQAFRACMLRHCACEGGGRWRTGTDRGGLGSLGTSRAFSNAGRGVAHCAGACRRVD